MKITYKIALGSAFMLCGALLAMYITSSPAKSSLKDSRTTRLPSASQVQDMLPPSMAVLPPTPAHWPLPTTPTSVQPAPPAPKVTPKQPGPPPTITLDGNASPLRPLPKTVKPTPAPTAPRTPPSTTVTKRPAPPKLRQYIILPGDTLISIATDEYGHEKYWVDIAQANPLKDPTRLYPGNVIKLPDKNLVRQRPQLSTRRADGTQLHIVRSGETLTGISKRYFGTTTHWRIIYNANRAKIGNDPNRFQAGTRLVIPKPPRIQR